MLARNSVSARVLASSWAVPDLLGNVIAVIVFTAASTLFNTTGIEVVVHREANLERELNITGFANILTGALGGYAGCISVSRTVLNFNNGGRGQLAHGYALHIISKAYYMGCIS